MRRRSAAILVIVLLGLSLRAASGVSQAQGLSGKEIKRFSNGTAQAIAWSPDGKQLVVGGSLGLWFFSPDLKLTAQRDTNDAEITAIAWNPNGKQIATASYARKVQLWDVTGGTFQTLETSEANASLFPNSMLYNVNWPGSLSFSPDGARLASASLDNAVHIWDTATGKLLSTLKTDGPVYAVAWNLKDARIAAGGQMTTANGPQGFLQVWDSATGKALNRYPDNPDLPTAPVSSVQWTDGGKSVALLFNSGNGEVKTWEPGGEPLLVTGDIGGSGPNGISYTPDGAFSAIAFSNPPVFVGVTPTSGIQVYQGMSTVGYVSVGGDMVRAMTWSGDGRYLAVIGGDNNVLVVDRTIRTDQSLALNPLATSAFFAAVPDGVDWSEDGRPIFVDHQAIEDPPYSHYYFVDAIQIKDLLSGAVLREWHELFTFYSFGFRTWVLSPDRKLLAGVQGNLVDPEHLFVVTNTQGADGHYGVISLEPPEGIINGEKAQIMPVYRLYWSRDGSRLASTGGGPLAIWDTQTGKLLVFVQIKASYSLSWSPDGRYLVSGYCDSFDQSSPFIVEAATGKVLFTLGEVVGGNTCSVVWGPQGRSLAMITADNQVYIWSAASGKLLQKLPGHSIEWSGSGERLAIATEEQTVQLYNTATGKLAATLKGGGAKTAATAFSPDNRRIATADGDGAIRVWDALTGKLLATLAGHKGPVKWVLWNPGSSQLLSYGGDETLRLWSVGGE